MAKRKGKRVRDRDKRVAQKKAAAAEAATKHKQDGGDRGFVRFLRSRAAKPQHAPPSGHAGPPTLPYPPEKQYRVLPPGLIRTLHALLTRIQESRVSTTTIRRSRNQPPTEPQPVIVGSAGTFPKMMVDIEVLLSGSGLPHAHRNVLRRIAGRRNPEAAIEVYMQGLAERGAGGGGGYDLFDGTEVGRCGFRLRYADGGGCGGSPAGSDGSVSFHLAGGSTPLGAAEEAVGAPPPLEAQRERDTTLRERRGARSPASRARTVPRQPRPRA